MFRPDQQEDLNEFNDAVQNISAIFPFMSYEALAGFIMCGRINENQNVTEDDYLKAVFLIKRALSN